MLLKWLSLWDFLYSPEMIDIELHRITDSSPGFWRLLPLLGSYPTLTTSESCRTWSILWNLFHPQVNQKILGCPWRQQVSLTFELGGSIDSFTYHKRAHPPLKPLKGQLICNISSCCRYRQDENLCPFGLTSMCNIYDLKREEVGLALMPQCCCHHPGFPCPSLPDATVTDWDVNLLSLPFLNQISWS